MAKKGKAGGNTDLVEQEHGGAIYQGAPKNPVAGPGRPPSKIRAALRKGFEDRVPALMDIADGVVVIRLTSECEHCGESPSEPLSIEEIEKAIPNVGERLKALDMMAKYGAVAPKGGLNEDDVRHRLQMTLMVVQEELEDSAATRVLDRLRVVWG